LGPATTNIDLGAIPNGTYPVNLTVESNESEGQLIVTTDYYAILLNNPKQLKITNNPLKRIPENTIWGTIGYHSGSTEALVSSLILYIIMVQRRILTRQAIMVILK
jgi:hypothetical protein